MRKDNGEMRDDRVEFGCPFCDDNGSTGSFYSVAEKNDDPKARIALFLFFLAGSLLALRIRYNVVGKKVNASASVPTVSEILKKIGAFLGGWVYVAAIIIVHCFVNQ